MGLEFRVRTTEKNVNGAAFGGSRLLSRRGCLAGLRLQRFGMLKQSTRASGRGLEQLLSQRTVCKGSRREGAGPEMESI